MMDEDWKNEGLNVFSIREVIINLLCPGDSDSDSTSLSESEDEDTGCDTLQ